MTAIPAPGLVSAGHATSGTPGRVLTLLHQRGPLSRAEVTAQLGLARSAVGKALGELTELGLVCTGARADAAATGRGRPSPILAVSPDGPGAIVVQLRPDRIMAGVIGLGRRIDHLAEVGLSAAEHDPRLLVPLIADVVTSARRQTARPCVGVCVAMPGFIRDRDGFVLSALHLGWHEVPLAERLSALLASRLPVTVGRASALAALAEFRNGAGRGAATVLTLNSEHVGVGGAFIADGAPLTGSGYALEAGHVVVAPDGPPCPCGARGCLELYADGRAFLRAAGLSGGGDPYGGADQVAELLRRAAAGDTAAVGAVRATAGHLAAGMTSLVNTLSPERVVLTGFLADLHRAAGDQIADLLRASSIVARTGQVLLTAGTVRHAALLGAADQAFAPLLADPRAVAGTSGRIVPA